MVDRPRLKITIVLLSSIEVRLRESAEKLKQVQDVQENKKKGVVVFFFFTIERCLHGVKVPAPWHHDERAKSKPLLHPTCLTNKSYLPYLSALTNEKLYIFCN